MIPRNKGEIKAVKYFPIYHKSKIIKNFNCKFFFNNILKFRHSYIYLEQIIF